jgi:hypothetical protein
LTEEELGNVGASQQTKSAKANGNTKSNGSKKKSSQE